MILLQSRVKQYEKRMLNICNEITFFKTFIDPQGDMFNTLVMFAISRLLIRSITVWQYIYIAIFIYIYI